MGVFPSSTQVTPRAGPDMAGAPVAEPVMKLLARQFVAFSGVGVLAAVVHYSVLVALVESGVAEPVFANLSAYVAGGIASYGLSRRYAFRSERAHSEATWRFALVAGVGFLLTGFFTHLFHDRFGAPYVVAALMTTGVVLFWSFAAHKMWTFRSRGS